MAGKAPVSYCAALLENQRQDGTSVEEEEYIKDTAGSIFAGGICP
jgi:hypothetical protein